jgi:hypothetical protein
MQLHAYVCNGIATMASTSLANTVTWFEYHHHHVTNHGLSIEFDYAKDGETILWPLSSYLMLYNMLEPVQFHWL